MVVVDDPTTEGIMKTITATRKYALTAPLAKIARSERLGRNVRISGIVAITASLYPLAVIQATHYSDAFFRGKLAPAILMGFAVTLLVGVLVFGLTHMVTKMVCRRIAKNLHADPLTRRISDDFNIPVETAADALRIAVLPHSTSAYFTHNSQFVKVEHLTEYDQQLGRRVDYIQAEASHAESISSELIVV